MKKFIIFFFCFLLVIIANAQKRYTISGYVKDAESGEALSGANVYFIELNKGTATNAYGYYSLTVPEGSYLFKVQSVGYRSFQETLTLNRNIKQNVELHQTIYAKDGVVVTASRTDDNIKTTAMGSQVVNVEALKKMPSFFGETDIIKTIQLMPGVQSSGEGSSGYHVRGGGIDQNLVLLDEAIIYNTGHLFGFFSIFNTDAIRSADLMKSGMSANYGGRLSSVLHVNMKEGNMKKYQVEGGIGLIFARLTAQGPIAKDKASFLVSARRTYVDALIQPFLRKESPLKGLKFYFYDINAKTNWVLNDKHRIFLSGYYGVDTYGFKGESSSMNARFTWKNASASFRWNYNITNKMFLNTSLLFSNYNFGTDIMMDVYSLTLKSGIRDYSLKSDLTYMPNSNNTLKFGGSYIFHRFSPNSYEVEAGSSLDIPLPINYFAHELALYANEEIDLGEFIRMNVGLRASYFSHVGKYVQYFADNFGRIQDSLEYKSGEKVKDYWGLEPRISFRFLLDKSLSLKASYMRNCQYLHQVALSSISLPTDVWMPSSVDIKPMIGNQYSIGIYKNLKQNMFELSVEAYYKTMKNITEYREGYSPLTQAANSLDLQFTQGEGYSYGFEFLINKTIGKLTGWIGYTLSWTKHSFPELNGGKEFYAKNDRRHDISITLSYDILPNLTASLVWVYATGNTMTIPVGFYFVGYNMVVQYSEKNAYRVPPYHRMDLSVNWIIRRTEKFEHALNFSVYNVYNRKNPFFISIKTQMEQKNMQISNQAYQMSLFPILPSISYNFKFN